MTKNEFITFCRGELGVTEYPAGSNKVKYNTDYYGREVSGSAYKWCAVFVWDMFRLAGMADRFYGGGKVNSCGKLMDYYDGKGLFETNPENWRVGDLAIFDWSGEKTGHNHVGIITAVDQSSRTVKTIEGNTSVDSDDNGGAVMERERSFDLITGACLIDYGEKKAVKTAEVSIPQIKNGSAGSAVKTAQILLNAVLGENLTVDGKFGAKTEKAVKSYQKQNGLSSDGIIGAKTWTAMIGGADK